MRYTIDINCDMGEGMENDESLLTYISTANIACGWHAGNETILRQTMILAQRQGVKVGAHPSYADRENFGRTTQYLAPSEIYSLIKDQLTLFKTIADEENISMHHIKPHGALYNMSAKDKVIAETIAATVKDFDSQLLLYGLSGSYSISAAQQAGLTAVSEVFADRLYLPDGSLAPRTHANAVLTNIPSIINQALLLVKENNVQTKDGTIHVTADSICLHGDTPGATAIAQKLAFTFRQNHITTQAYARP